MRVGILAALIGCSLFLACPRPAAAQPSWLSEIRGGVLDHDIPLFGHHKESGVDGNLEVLFASPSFLEAILRPRPILGMSINSDGNTNALYFGLTWGVRLTPHLFGPADPVFLTGTLGGAANDGHIDVSKDPNLSQTQKSLGSHLLFREAVELGYEFVPRNSISIMLDHMSNARLAERNEGITNVGLRYGYRF
jgi:lipid A 3-O-deacylase